MIKSEYPKNWKELSDRCKQRDGHRCVICKSIKNIEAHHTRNNPTVENLITLCKKCHRIVGGSNRKLVRELNEIRLNPNSKKEEIESKFNEVRDVFKKHFEMRERLNKQYKLKMPKDFYTFEMHGQDTKQTQLT